MGWPTCFWLTEHQLERIKLFFPKPRGVRRVDESKVLSGSIHVLRYRLPWVDAPAACGPHKILSNRCRRWSEKGIFQLLFAELARSDGTETEEEVLMVDATDVAVVRHLQWRPRRTAERNIDAQRS